jgi:hypothetical protein
VTKKSSLASRDCLAKLQLRAAVEAAVEFAILICTFPWRRPVNSDVNRLSSKLYEQDQRRYVMVERQVRWVV